MVPCAAHEAANPVASATTWHQVAKCWYRIYIPRCVSRFWCVQWVPRAQLRWDPGVCPSPASPQRLWVVGEGRSCVERVRTAHPDPPGDRRLSQKASRESSRGSCPLNQPRSCILYYCNLCLLLFSRPDAFLPSASFSVHCSFD